MAVEARDRIAAVGTMSTAADGHVDAGHITSSGLRVVRYEDTSSAKPPIAVAVIPPRDPTRPRSVVLPSSLSQPSVNASSAARSTSSVHADDVDRHDSGLGPTASTLGSTTIPAEEDSKPSPTSVSTAPPQGSTRERRRLSRPNLRGLASPRAVKAAQQVDEPRPPPPKVRISMEIPSESLFGLDTLDQMSFSTRGSILLAGKRAGQRPNLRTPANRRRGASSQLTPVSSGASSEARPVPTKLLSTEEEQLSEKVRSKYERGDSLDDADNDVVILIDDVESTEGVACAAEDGWTLVEGRKEPVPPAASPRAPESLQSRRLSAIQRDTHEFAGGLEDWHDVNGRDVDRYGFITGQSGAAPDSPTSSRIPSRAGDGPRPHRVSTILQLASETPRKNRSLRRANSNSRNSPSIASHLTTKNMSTPSLRKPASLLSQEGSIGGRPSRNPFRFSVNRLPHGRHRRWMDEAGNMLTLPPALADIAEDRDDAPAAVQVRRKETERAEKWRKMARVVNSKGAVGQGMAFEFDMHDPKLISRTWKGIPDCWRATAWHAFLASSARQRKEGLGEEEIVQKFWEYMDQSSPDDVQIDIDVPRTISGHIMFRRRYRGGQRLLFRVLHALSIHFPDTGYVQGMASLAATLLCYYDEERTFVMLVRMWQLRGLQQLFQPGFGGLMEALAEFEKVWLAGEPVSNKLRELGVDSTAYGTRWYLTLFNYSIPFAAQLRVWDVFMLLGDAPVESAAGSTPALSRGLGGLDVLHATSAALIAGMREILLDSDFENAMKVLTSWIPIRDEELLMRVAHAQWRLHHRSAAKGARSVS